jgi:hypothetical protein
VRCRPGTVPDCDGPGSAVHRSTSLRAASHPGHTSLGRVRSLIHFSNSPDLLVPAAHVCARGLQLCFAHPNRGGGRSAEKRSGAAAPVGRATLRHKTRVNALMTRHARRLRGALRPMTRDARLSALHRGDFGLRGRASLTGIGAGSVTASSSHPGRSAWRAGSPASRGERLRAACRRTPRLAPHSGSSLEHALNERGWASSSIGTIRSQ